MNRKESEVYPNLDTTNNEAGILGRALSQVGNFLSNNKNKLTATATAAVLTLTLAGCGVSATAEGPKPETSNSDTPSPTPSETAPNVLTPNEYTDQQIMDLMNEPLPENLAVYESMPVTEFEKLPIEERLAYNSYLTRDQDYLESVWYKGYDNDPSYLVEENLSKDSDPMQVVVSAGYFASNAFTTHFGGFAYDRDTSQKILASGFFDASTETDAQYAKWTKARDETETILPPGSLAEQGKLKIGAPPTGEASPYNITTPDGKEYFAREISTTSIDGSALTTVYILVDYTDYKGEAKQAYVYYESK